MIKVQRIKEIIDKSIPSIQKEHIKQWFCKHKITPKSIYLEELTSPNEQKKFWLVTENIGEEDSGYRIVHSVEKEFCFGLELTSDNGEAVFLGFDGELNETLENM